MGGVNDDSANALKKLSPSFLDEPLEVEEDAGDFLRSECRGDERNVLKLCGEHLLQLGHQLREASLHTNGQGHIATSQLSLMLEQSTRHLRGASAPTVEPIHKNLTPLSQRSGRRNKAVPCPAKVQGDTDEASSHALDTDVHEDHLDPTASKQAVIQDDIEQRERDLRELTHAHDRPLTNETTRTRYAPECVKHFHIMVNGPRWESFWALMIVTNIALMITEEEYNGMRQGNDMGVYSYYGSDGYVEQWWPGSSEFFAASEVSFAILFTIELCCNISSNVLEAAYGIPREVGRVPVWKSPWDMIDILVVLTADISLMEKVFGDFIPFSPNLLRIFRLARLLRLLKLLRKFQSFDPAMMITTALRGSLDAQAAAYMLLLLFLTLPALVLTNVVRQFYLGAESQIESKETREELFLLFGTYTRSMVSMFELALGNWPPITRFLMEELHQLFGVFCVVFKLTVGFAVISVINGVFIKACFSAAENDDVILVRNRMKQIFQHKDRMTRFFQLADINGDGKLSLDEFRSVLRKPVIKTWLEAMELRCSDADLLFSMLAGPDHKVTAEQLINGVARLRGAARNIDILSILQASIFHAEVAWCDEEPLDLDFQSESPRGRQEMAAHIPRVARAGSIELEDAL